MKGIIIFTAIVVLALSSWFVIELCGRDTFDNGNKEIAEWISKAPKPIYKLSQSQTINSDLTVVLMDSAGNTKTFYVHGIWLPDTIKTH